MTTIVDELAFVSELIPVESLQVSGVSWAPVAHRAYFNDPTGGHQGLVFMSHKPRIFGSKEES